MKRELVPEDLQRIRELLEKEFQVSPNDITDIRRGGGMTNHTYFVDVCGETKYSVRIPGEGTEELLDRRAEEISTRLACRIGVDAELLYFGKDGTKVTVYIPHAVTMHAGELREKHHMEQMAEILSRLHNCGENTGIPFEVFDMASGYETIIRKNDVPVYEDYEAVKGEVAAIQEELEALYEKKPVPCHNDPLCENWVEGDGILYLIDWEYAGMNEDMWDVADVSIEADMDAEQDAFFLEKYLGHRPDSLEWKRFIANKIYLDYLWTLWGLTRVPFDGKEMEEYAAARYDRLKENLTVYRQRGGMK